MSADQNVAHLHAPIRAILTAPGVDLSSISAKRVRRQLVDDGHADSALVKAHKGALDALIGEVFSEVNVGNTGAGDGGESEANGEDGYGEGAETQEDGGDTDGVDGEEEARDEKERPVKKERKPAGKKRKAVEDDEAVARALHAQINGGRPSRAAAPPAKKRAKKTKSAETVDGEDAPKKKRGGGGGFQKPYHLSEVLCSYLSCVLYRANIICFRIAASSGSGHRHRASTNSGQVALGAHQGSGLAKPKRQARDHVRRRATCCIRQGQSDHVQYEQGALSVRSIFLRVAPQVREQ